MSRGMMESPKARQFMAAGDVAGGCVARSSLWLHVPGELRQTHRRSQQLQLPLEISLPWP